MKPRPLKLAVGLAGFTAASLLAAAHAPSGATWRPWEPQRGVLSPLPLKRIPLQSLGLTDAPATRQASSTALLCIKLTDDANHSRRIPVSSATTLQLSFRHSIYGSQIDEVFSPLADGFQLTQLRYGEARLVEFYGHENAQQKNGVWIVTPAPTVLPSLHLRSSTAAAMSLRIDRAPTGEPVVIPVYGAARLTVAPCDPGAHG